MIWTEHCIDRISDKERNIYRRDKKEISMDIKNHWATLVYLGYGRYRVIGEYYMYILADNTLITILPLRKDVSKEEWGKVKKKSRKLGYRIKTISHKEKRKIRSVFNFKI